MQFKVLIMYLTVVSVLLNALTQINMDLGLLLAL